MAIIRQPTKWMRLQSKVCLRSMSATKDTLNEAVDPVLHLSLFTTAAAAALQPDYGCA
jgi:hypothetical protein